MTKNLFKLPVLIPGVYLADMLDMGVPAGIDPVDWNDDLATLRADPTKLHSSCVHIDADAVRRLLWDQDLDVGIREDAERFLAEVAS